MIGPTIPEVTTGRRLNVLIASARAPVIESLADAVRSQGHQPVVQETAEGASAALASPAIDAVLIDPSLPGLDWDQLRAVLSGAGGQPESLEAVEKRHIAAMLRHTRGNRRNAAHLLGIARSTLLAKIRKYGLDRDPALSRG
jgi:DNA-binding NtrC family response regulator